MYIQIGECLLVYIIYKHFDIVYGIGCMTKYASIVSHSTSGSVGSCLQASVKVSRKIHLIVAYQDTIAINDRAMREPFHEEHIRWSILIFGSRDDALLDVVSCCEVSGRIGSAVHAHQDEHATFTVGALGECIELLGLGWASIAPWREEVDDEDLASRAQAQQRSSGHRASRLAHLHVKIWSCGTNGSCCGRHCWDF